VAANVAQDAATNGNTAATQYSITADLTVPTVTITSAATSPTKGAFTATFTFSEAVTGFVIGDITVGNGTASNFSATSATVYTATITPTTDGAVTVDVAANVAQDAATNGNTAATQYSITADLGDPIVLSVSLFGTPSSSASTVDFVVIFNKAVTGVDISDFALDASVGVSANLANISGSGSEYTVTVNGISGHGTLSVDLKSSGTGIIGLASNPLLTGFTRGATHSVGSAFDISKAIFDGEEDVFSVADQESDPRAIAFSTDGSKMFVMGVIGGDINEYSLSNAYDVSTAVYAGDSERLTGIPVGTPAAMAFNPDGTILHVLLFSPGKIVKYYLSTGFDVSTVSSTLTTDLIISPYPGRSITFSRDGRKMFLLGNNTDGNQDEIYVYNLSTPFDYGSLTSIDQRAFSVHAEEDLPVSLAFNSAGTKMYVLGNDVKDINEYNLSVAFDVTTAVYAGDAERFSVATQESAPRSMAFNADGTKMYILGRNGDDVNEYSIASPVITGTVAGQAVNDNATITPFASITVADPNGDNVSAIITLDDNTKGVLSGAGLSGSGPYTLVSTDASSLQASLRALVFDPTDDRVVFGNTETTIFTLEVNDGIFKDTDSRTTVVTNSIRPSLTITSAATSPTNGAFLTTFTFSEAVTGFVIGDITVGNGVASNFSATSATVYTATITPATDGAVTVDVAANVAQDAATNGNSAAAQLIFIADLTSPTVEIQGVPAWLNNFDPFVLTFAFNEPVVDFAANDLVLVNATISSFDIVSSTSYQISLVANTNTTLGISLPTNKLQDLAGNPNVVERSINIEFNSLPTDILLSETEIDENNALADEVGIMTTADADVGDVQTYSLVAGTGDDDNDKFSVTFDKLRTATIFDFELKSTYKIRLKTDDGHGGVFEKAFTISINNLNENPTNITLSNNVIDESDETNVLIGVMTATDQDDGESFTYELVSGDGDENNAMFSIDGNELFTNQAINFEDNEALTFRLKVTDSGGLTFEKSFEIAVLNVENEELRSFTKDSQNAQIKNFFTPNGDGINDKWVIDDILDNPINEVKVFGLDGKLLFSKRNYQNDWEGKFEGQLLPSGTYYYEINIFNGAAIIQGVLLLLTK
uniref:Ig-like domain-containing protein n=1 Tax=Roseivirga sp. TaxID=1964215 RepID=UPI0040481521